MKYYTYVLIDPISGRIFYVGKGQKLRMYQHIKDVQRGRIPNGSNVYLGRKIEKILSSGNKVKYKKVLITENSQEAFDKEIELIKEIGLKNLCNIQIGGEGIFHTDEIKRKMSRSMKGRIPWNKGLKWSMETKQKISNALIGRVLSEDHKEKIKKNLINMTGKIHTKETKRKMSNSHKGKKFSNEHKQKMSESKLGKNNPMFGKTHTKETRKKISNSLILNRE